MINKILLYLSTYPLFYKLELIAINASLTIFQGTMLTRDAIGSSGSFKNCSGSLAIEENICRSPSILI